MNTINELREKIKEIRAQQQAAIEEERAAIADLSAQAAARGYVLRKIRPASTTSGSGYYVSDDGKKWYGKGKRPKWLSDAIANGATLEDFHRAYDISGVGIGCELT
jgi:DNA-binding protein H-NS